MSDLSAISDSVATLLNDNMVSLGMPFWAEKVYTPVYNEKNNPGLKVFVLPAKSEITQTTRTESQRIISVYIPIYNTIPMVLNEYTNENERDPILVDQMLQFVEKVCDLLIKNENSVGGSFYYELTNDPAYNPQALNEKGVFASLITCQFILVR